MLPQAPMPAQIIDKGIPIAGLLAQVLVAKYADHFYGFDGTHENLSPFNCLMNNKNCCINNSEGFLKKMT